MAKFCSGCGTPIQAGSRFCANCGAQLQQETVKTAPDVAESTPPTANETASSQFTEKSAGKQEIESDEWNYGDGYTAELVDSSAIPRILRAANILLHGSAFFTLYLFLAIPTYILPWLGSNSTLINGLSAAEGVGAFPLFYLHLTFLYALCVLAWLRGTLIGRQWLVIFPIFATIFDLTPGLNWILLVPTIFHILTLSLGVSKSPAEEAPIDIGGRAALGLVGLGAFVLLTIVKMLTYQSSMNSALADSAPPMNPPNFQSTYQPPAVSNLSMTNMTDVPAAQVPRPTVQRVTFASVGEGATDGSQWVEQNSPPSGPLTLGVKWYYSGAQVSQSFNCLNDNSQQLGTLRFESGWVGCYWNNVGTGPHKVRLIIDGQIADDRTITVPSMVDTDEHLVALSDGVMPPWIRIPDGYGIDYNYTPVTSVGSGMQCSLSFTRPPDNADGKQYWCNFKNMKARWIRSYIYQHNSPTAEFRYHFRKLPPN